MCFSCKSWWVVRDIVEQDPKEKERKDKKKIKDVKKMSTAMKKMLNETLNYYLQISLHIVFFTLMTPFSNSVQVPHHIKAFVSKLLKGTSPPQSSHNIVLKLHHPLPCPHGPLTDLYLDTLRIQYYLRINIKRNRLGYHNILAYPESLR